MYKFGMYQIEFQMFWFIYQQNSHHRNLEDGSSPEVMYGPNMPTSSMLPLPSSLSSIGGGPSSVGLGPSMLPSPSSLSSIGGGPSPVGLGPSMLESSGPPCGLARAVATTKARRSTNLGFILIPSQRAA